MASQEQTVEQLFGAALDRRPEDRRAFLDRVCAGAPELRQRVEELLLADEQAGSFLERKLRISMQISLTRLNLIWIQLAVLQILVLSLPPGRPLRDRTDYRGPVRSRSLHRSRRNGRSLRG